MEEKFFLLLKHIQFTVFFMSSIQQGKSQITSNIGVFGRIGVLTIMSLYIFFVVINSTNIPFYDDFGQQFLVVELLQSGEWYNALFRQHNEHRLFTTFIIPAFTWSLFGWVNMKTTIFLGILTNLALFWLLNQLKSNQSLNVLSFSMALLLLAPAGIDATWAGGTMQYYGVIFFGILSIHSLTLTPKMGLFVSLASLFLASVSMISGLLASIPGILYLLVSSRGRPTRQLIAFTVISCGIWVWYMFGYEKPSYHPSLLTALQSPLFGLKYYMAFTGNIFADWIPVHQIVVASAVIHLILAVILFRYLKRFDFSDARWYMLLYIFLAILSIVAGRSGFLSLEQALSDRYQIYSATYWSLILILLARFNLLNAKVQYLITGFLLFLFITTSLKQWPACAAHKRKLEDGLFLLLSSDDPSQLQLQSPEHAKTYILKAMNKGYYHPPAAVKNRLKSIPSQKPNAITPLNNHSISKSIQKGHFAGYIDRIAPSLILNTREKQMVTINGWAAINAQNGVLCDSIFVFIESANQQQYIANTSPDDRPDVSEHFNNPIMTQSGYRTTFEITALQQPINFGLLCATNGKIIHCENIQKKLSFPVNQNIVSPHD